MSRSKSDWLAHKSKPRQQLRPNLLRLPHQHPPPAHRVVDQAVFSGSPNRKVTANSLYSFPAACAEKSPVQASAAASARKMAPLQETPTTGVVRTTASPSRVEAMARISESRPAPPVEQKAGPCPTADHATNSKRAWNNHHLKRLASRRAVFVWAFDPAHSTSTACLCGSSSRPPSSSASRVR